LLHKEAARLRRFELVGTSAELDKVAPILDREWAARVNLRLDFEKLLSFLSVRQRYDVHDETHRAPAMPVRFPLGIESMVGCALTTIQGSGT
jgi:hypothetical protein